MGGPIPEEYTTLEASDGIRDATEGSRNRGKPNKGELIKISLSTVGAAKPRATQHVLCRVVDVVGAAKPRAALRPLNSKIVNEKFSIRIGNDRKRKETRGDTDGTIILFLIPWYFSVKYQGIKEQYYRPLCVSSCFFPFSVVPNPLLFLLNFFNLLVIIINHLRPKSSGRVAHDSHKLQTKAINHSTRRYMNRRELQSDQPIRVRLLRVLSFPPTCSAQYILS